MELSNNRKENLPKQKMQQLESLKEWRKSTLEKLVSAYPTSSGLMAVTNFDNVFNHIKNKTEKEIMLSNKPLLHEIEKVYGNETVIQILTGYIYKFQTLLNIKDEYKLNDAQMSMCANNAITHLRGLTISEIASMFKRFLSGEFGHFYGNIDIMTLGEWVIEFKRKRGDLILKDKEIRNFLVLRDQNYDENKIKWLEDAKNIRK